MTDDLTRPIETPQPARTEPPPAGTEPPRQPATEVATAPAGTQPVVAAGAPGSNRLRWAIGLGIAGLAVAVVLVAVFVLGSRPAPEALKYIPADAAMVIEIRPDLPGDQMQKLGNLLAHFPGFKDQSTLPDKLDEAFSRLVGQASDGKLDYRTNLKPWLSGPAFVALLPSTDGATSGHGALEHGVASLTTTGTVTCAAVFENQAASHETYKGLDLNLAPAPSSGACVIDGRQALIGDAASVRAAIDAHAGGTGLDKDAAYQKARATLSGDQLVTAYVDGKAYLAMYATMLDRVGGMPGLGSGVLPTVPPSFPEWVVAGFRAEDDALVVDTFTAAPLPAASGSSAPPSLLPIPPGHASVFAPLAPAGTLAFFEVQGAGVALQNAITSLRSYPDLGPALQMLDGAGGAGRLLGWIEDLGVLVVEGADGPTGGVLLAATDEKTANQQVSTVLGLIAFAGIGSNGIQTRESTIGGVKVTTITIEDVGSLVPPGQLPPGVDVPADASVEFSIAAKGNVILLAPGEAFMNAVLSMQPGSGLVDQDLYKRATSRALSNSQLTMYVGIRDLVALAETRLPADEKARWDSELKPYFAPFEALSLTATTDGGSGHARMTLSVGNP